MTLPTLSEVRAWTPDYLIDAADHWDGTARTWRDTFDRLVGDVQSPGGTAWTGVGADAALDRVADDRRRVFHAVDGVLGSALGARAAAGDLSRARAKLLAEVDAAEKSGFVVGEDYSVRCSGWNLSPRLALMRRAQAAMLSADLRADAATLAALDFDAAESIKAAVGDLRALTFDELSFGPWGPLPERPLPPPPPGGWSKDPIRRAAEKIVAHSWSEHHDEWDEGTTREQITDDVERMLRDASNPKTELQVGLDQIGTPVIYDEETNVWIIRNPDAVYGGTVFRPTNGKDKVRTSMRTHLHYLSRDKLGFPDEEVPRHRGPKFDVPQPKPGPRIGGPPIMPPPQLAPGPRNEQGKPLPLDPDGINDPDVSPLAP